MKLNDETDEEVDMLLLYLYTLDTPKFTDKNLFNCPFRGACSALKLGDKYGLPDLSKAGEDFLVGGFSSLTKSWHILSADSKSAWIEILGIIWAMEGDNTEIVGDASIKSLVEIGKDITEHEGFQDLCVGNSDFALAFLLAQAEKLHKHHKSPRCQVLDRIERKYEAR